MNPTVAASLLRFLKSLPEDDNLALLTADHFVAAPRMCQEVITLHNDGVSISSVEYRLGIIIIHFNLVRWIIS